MAMYSAAKQSWATAAVADSATATIGQVHGVRSAINSMYKINEVFIGGESVASAVNAMVLARTSTPVSSGAISVGTITQLHPQSAASTVAAGSTYATTYPTVGTLHALNLSLNCFGGIIRWVAAPGEEIVILAPGTVAFGDGEVTLRAVTGTGTISDHIVLEQC